MKNEIVILITYFFIYSFIGWVLESTYKTILQKKLVNSGFLLGPFCPIYGFGALIMYLSLRNLTSNIFVLFFFGVIVLSAFEYFVGWFLEVVFRTKYWDYSSNRFNIHGRVCLKNSLYWGFLGIVFMKGIHPAVENIVKLIPQMLLITAVLVLMVVMMLDTITTIVRLVKINSKLKNWNKITEKIRKQIETINVKSVIRFENISKLKFEHNYGLMKRIVEAKDRKQLLGHLKEEQRQLQEKLERRIARLRKAFPTMNSERLAKFFNNMKKS